MDKKRMNECLIAMQKDGCNQAFEQLYNESRKGVFSFIYAYVPNFHDAEDILQQTFINVKKYASTYSQGTNASAWLLQIAKNNCLNFLKKQSREVVFTDCEQQISSMTAEQTELDGTLLKALDGILDEKDRKIVLLHLVAGLKHREIASDLEMPLGTVLWRYNKAIKLLKTRIKKEDYEE